MAAWVEGLRLQLTPHSILSLPKKTTKTQPKTEHGVNTNASLRFSLIGGNLHIMAIHMMHLQAQMRLKRIINGE